MPMVPPKKRPQPPRSDDFMSVARALGYDENKAMFEAKLKKIAKAWPKPKTIKR